ncbi:hypothetical protein Deipr_1397 [Deinococcus proteolyticus MRP]|uniref:Phage holin family protein n=1 Tax=Deinococcus proteolyticus (strain ATCC 35074 / DSM 20540 / JCM 6276 / NBRC 101906 / NCIMB 13154 / VKM Ac-1939 / CCM 2703 / MRP) TaxID=693977 RepID=F0RJA4_DEIPM|nr:MULTISPECIES: phage holin family protein [Deinococcus]ADY26541.1 hypothetical protein Deipr_1397 [Deinococcus proteolyticus MRP]MCY1702665.1 phage holin family protein [Deinococcus sp. SL84]
MQEERKTSMGSAIVDVFDAGVALVKAEINSLAHKVGELAKSKGIGVILLLAALVPLALAAIFLILAIYFGLVALGLPWWAAALIMFLGSLVLAGVMVALGLNKLSEGIGQEHRALTEDERLEAEYLAEQRRQRNEGGAPISGAVVATGVPVSVGSGQRATAHYDRSNQHDHGAQYGQTHTTVVSSAPRVQHVAATGAASQVGAASGMVQPSVQDAHAIPVYEANADGGAQYYGQGLNEKLDPQHAGHHGDHGHDHDPNVVHPEVLEGAPEVRVSTQPTYADDMNRAEGGDRK